MGVVNDPFKAET
jgi:hypothetical protein